VTLIVNDPEAVGVPLIVLVVPVVLFRLSPAGRPVAVQVYVPPVHPPAVKVADVYATFIVVAAKVVPLAGVSVVA